MKQKHLPLNADIVALLLVGVLLVACGDPTATLAPTPTKVATTVPTTTTVVTTAPTTVATTAPTTTAVEATTDAFTTEVVIPALPGYISTDVAIPSNVMPKTLRGIVGNTPDVGYWLDGDNNVILKIGTSGKLLLQFGSKGSEDGQLNLPPRYVPQGMAIHSQNRLYVADTLNNRVQVFSTEGNFLAKWGTEGKADGQFIKPEAMVLGPDGSLYVSDEN